MERIGNCRVLGEIGSGGMAIIYKAVHEPLKRMVAIKALKRSVSHDSLIAIRFEREALSMAALQHENILHIYDFQQSGDASFIIMEYVEGIDLYDLLERCATIPPDVAAIVAMQTARALDCAHYHGIVHRDIKPANIMLAHSGGIKLMDFGIARDRSFGDLTEQGTGLGTPSYMSPEQIMGERLDARSDLFSLGVVLYQMVCGTKPFLADDNRSVLYKIRHEKPQPPRRVNPNVPRELERIILTCLEKRSEERYRSAQELTASLEAFVAPRCAINYKARLVQFLAEQGVLTKEEAEGYLQPPGEGDVARVRLDQPGGKLQPLARRMARPLTYLSTTALGALLTYTISYGTVRLRSNHEAKSVAPAITQPALQTGYLRVVVDPWAEVFVDGKLVETTPLAAPITVPEGKHQVELGNPFYERHRQEIWVTRGATRLLKVALKRLPQ